MKEVDVTNKEKEQRDTDHKRKRKEHKWREQYHIKCNPLKEGKK